MQNFKFNIKKEEVEKINILLSDPVISNHKNICKEENITSFYSKLNDELTLELSIFAGKKNILASLYLTVVNDIESEEYQEDITKINNNDTYNFITASDWYSITLNIT